jgi:hypothetical protein
VPRRVAIVASNNGDEKKAKDTGEEFVMATEHDFKHKTWQTKDHFKKLVKVICPNHSYLVKQKPKDCTTMKKFMMSGAFSKGRKPRGAHGKGAVRILGEVKVMTIFD